MVSGQPNGRWVVLDVGETLIDETRIFATWAEVLGIPEFTLMAVLGGSISNEEKPEDWRDFFELLQQPEWRDRQPEVEERFGGFRVEDLYADALRAIDGLGRQGYRLAITANQPARRRDELRAIGVDVEVMAMSEAMGVSKPDPAFFERTLELMGSPDPGDVAYVGDRVDNDIRPSRAAGMRAIWIRRGPWGHLQDDRDGAAHLIVRTLDELTERIGEAWEPQADVRSGEVPGLRPPRGR